MLRKKNFRTQTDPKHARLNAWLGFLMKNRFHFSCRAVNKNVVRSILNAPPPAFLTSRGESNWTALPSGFWSLECYLTVKIAMEVTRFSELSELSDTVHLPLAHTWAGATGFCVENRLRPGVAAFIMPSLLREAVCAWHLGSSSHLAIIIIILLSNLSEVIYRV